MGLKNRDGIDIKQYWSDGVKTYLGMMFNGFPNAFTCYTPHGTLCPFTTPTTKDLTWKTAPTALSNGPTIIEAQCDFIAAMISTTLTRHIKSIQPSPTAQVEWQGLINMMNEHTLFPLTNSWWNASNIPNKTPQMLTYPAGIKMYEEQCTATLADLKGYEVEYLDGHQPKDQPGVGSKEEEVKRQVDGAIGDVDVLDKEIGRGEVRIGA